MGWKFNPAMSQAPCLPPSPEVLRGSTAESGEQGGSRSPSRVPWLLRFPGTQSPGWSASVVVSGEPRSALAAVLLLPQSTDRQALQSLSSPAQCSPLASPSALANRLDFERIYFSSCFCQRNRLSFPSLPSYPSWSPGILLSGGSGQQLQIQTHREAGQGWQ